MSDELYLILHKVRGEPAFDVACQDRDMRWIIPTSGHRAYPVAEWHLLSWFPLEIPEIPKDWPDHYRDADFKIDISALFQEVPVEIKRRKL